VLAVIGDVKILVQSALDMAADHQAQRVRCDRTSSLTKARKNTLFEVLTGKRDSAEWKSVTLSASAVGA
jgi:hypothetical protein